MQYKYAPLSCRKVSSRVVSNLETESWVLDRVGWTFYCSQRSKLILHYWTHDSFLLEFLDRRPHWIPRRDEYVFSDGHPAQALRPIHWFLFVQAVVLTEIVPGKLQRFYFWVFQWLGFLSHPAARGSGHLLLLACRVDSMSGLGLCARRESSR